MPSKYSKDNVRPEFELQIEPKLQKSLSKKQQTFNRLTQRIGALKQDIKEESGKLEVLMGLCLTEIVPQHARIARSRIALAKVLARATERIRFSSRHFEAIGEAIVSLCEEAFAEIEVDAELESFYNQWAEHSYREKLNRQLQRSKEMFADMMRDRYDVDIDVEDIEDSTEGFAQFRQRMREQLEAERQQFWTEHRQKSDKQRQREAAQKAQKELAQRSIRSIYIALAKVVHPDSESDEALKASKEEVMKRVTVAYEQQDLQTLLALELEWIHQTTENLLYLADEKLQVYLAVLKQQVDDLEREKIGLLHSPQYGAVATYSSMPLNIAKSRLLKDKRALRDYNNQLVAAAAAFRGAAAKHPIMEFVAAYNNRARSSNLEDYWEDIQI
jgi:hypothetical protein